MNLLSIDTSTDQASIALLANNSIYHVEQGSQKTHAQIVLPMINRLLVDAGMQLTQLDGIVFGRGPGSFTGLRIACSIAKGLAYSHDLSLIPVSSLATIAWSARKEIKENEATVLAVLDARMQELYWGIFREWQYETEEHVTKAERIQAFSDKSIVVAGVGIDLYWGTWPDRIKKQITHRLTLYPSAAAMIELACEQGIKPISAAQAQPVYVRNQVTQGESGG